MNEFFPLCFLSKTTINNRTTLDSFVIKQEPVSQYLPEPILKTETTKKRKSSLAKHGQRSIEDYMIKDMKSSAKRFKK